MARCKFCCFNVSGKAGCDLFITQSQARHIITVEKLNVKNVLTKASETMKKAQVNLPPKVSSTTAVCSVSLFLTSLVKPVRQQTAHLITVMSFHYCVAFMTVAVG